MVGSKYRETVEFTKSAAMEILNFYSQMIGVIKYDPIRRQIKISAEMSSERALLKECFLALGAQPAQIPMHSSRNALTVLEADAIVDMLKEAHIDLIAGANKEQLLR